MAETHEHTRTIHLYHIELPFGLMPKDLEYEAGSHDGIDFLQTMEELAGYSPDEVKRVITAAAALIARHPHRTPEAALYTAMVWERG